MMFYDLFHNEKELHRVNAGDYLFKAGDKGEVMYVLISGKAQILLGSKVMEDVEPGAILGEMSLIEHTPHSASVLAVSDCEFAAINQKRFHYLIAQTPHFATEIMRIMAHRLRATNRLIAE